MLAPGPIMVTVVVFGSMILLSMLQSFGISQLDLPYAARSVMVITAGGASGFAASQVWLYLLHKIDSGTGSRHKGS